MSRVSDFYQTQAELWECECGEEHEAVEIGDFVCPKKREHKNLDEAISIIEEMFKGKFRE